MKYSPPTIRNELDRLKRKVARNSPSPNFFQRTTTLNEATSGYHHENVNVSEIFTNDASYRDYITGDTYANRWLKFHYTSGSSSLGQFRLIVYSPKVASTEFNPSDSPSGFVTQLDPSAFTVFYDSMKVNPNSIQPLHFSQFVSLRNIITEYNGSSSIMEKGNIRVCCIWDNTNSGNGGTLGWQLSTLDK